ncbi:MAG TPA: hypothetical protein VJL80_07755 [Aeromicrobium sp.]|nr:hypothetical protein [Aeromicrobium sp.]HKY57914.1 hypothetical protein [Aeromicrobium sp.]
MATRRLLAAVLSVSTLVLTGCGGVPQVTPRSSASAGPVVPTIGPGSVMTDALTEAHCVRASTGTWTANGVVKNTTKQTRSFDVNIYIGPADGEAGVAQVVTVKKLAAGKSAPWTATAVQATSPTGPCYIRVRITK